MTPSAALSLSRSLSRPALPPDRRLTGPVPCTAQFMIPCGDCYTDCDDEGYSTPDANTIDGKCGYGFVRKSDDSGAVVSLSLLDPVFPFLRLMSTRRTWSADFLVGATMFWGVRM